MKSVVLMGVCVTLAVQTLLAANCTAAMARQIGLQTAVRHNVPLNTAQQLPVSQHALSHCTSSDLSLTAAPHALDVLALSTPFLMIRCSTPHTTLPRLIDPPPRAFFA